MIPVLNALNVHIGVYGNHEFGELNVCFIQIVRQ